MLLQNASQNANKGMPPTLAQGGRSFATPSKNVTLGNRQKSKKLYNCSICGTFGPTDRKFNKIFFFNSAIYLIFEVFSAKENMKLRKMKCMLQN